MFGSSNEFGIRTCICSEEGHSRLVQLGLKEVRTAHGYKPDQTWGSQNEVV